MRSPQRLHQGKAESQEICNFSFRGGQAKGMMERDFVYYYIQGRQSDIIIHLTQRSILEKHKFKKVDCSKPTEQRAQHSDPFLL